MVKKDKASTAPAETAEAEGTSRVGVLHQAHADYIKEHKGVDVTAEQVFAVYSTRVPFRKSDAYQTGVRQAKADEKAAAQKAKDDAKAQREADRKAKADEKAKAKAEKDAAAAEAKAKADAEKPATEKPAAKKAASGKGAKGGKGKGKTDSPF